jgi:hypothetical protein
VNQNSLTLYRPVGLREMELILAADSKAFPPRLPEQPYFYPVMNAEYAIQIARDWNTKDPKSGFAGFVTQFSVDENYATQFEVHTVGSSVHRELWIPAEQLDDFNQHIQGHIEIVDAFYGEGYEGIKHWHKEWYADEMFDVFYNMSWYNGMDFSGEMTMNRHAVLLNFKYWLSHDYSQAVFYEGEQMRFLRFLADIWKWKFPDVHLPGSEVLG